MSFEDDLRATMRAHDHEAPTVLPVVRSPRPRRWLPALLAAALVVAGAVALAVVRSDHADRPASAPACPAVPAGNHGQRWTPSSTASSSERLVPTAVPDAGVVCRYASDGSFGRRTLTDLADIPDALAYTPRWSELDAKRQRAPLCTGKYGNTNYMTGLRYGRAVVWISTVEGPCGTAGDTATDRFIGRPNLGPNAAAAFATSHWPADSTAGDGSCAIDSYGRLNDDRVLIPAGVTSIEPCGSGHRLTGRSARALATRLDAPVTTPGTNHLIGCPSELHSFSVVRLVARYRIGPAVTLDYSPECTGIANRELTAILPIGLRDELITLGG